MYTKNILMIITIILFGISNGYAREIIKTCWVNDEYKGRNVFVFPKDGGKPYGNEVAILLSMTNALNLEIEFIEEKENKDNFNYNCYKRLNDGTIDIMPNQDDIHQDYAGNVPYFKGPKDWGLPGNKHLNFAISKKSKFFSRIEEFKSAILTQKEYNKILHATYTSADQHDWPEESKKKNDSCTFDVARDTATNKQKSNLKKFLKKRKCPKCDLRNVGDMSSVSLEYANLSGSNLKGAKLLETNLSHSNLSNANLSGANLKGANLFKTNLSGANLSCANLSGANLIKSNLSGANLSGANLIKSNLRGAELGKANLSGANFKNAILTDSVISGIIIDDKAKSTNSFFVKKDESKNLSKEEVKIKEFDLLKTVYFAYIASKHCVEVRKDYPHYLDKDTFNSRKKITKVWEDYIESKYSDVDKDKLWDEANKMWNRWSQKPLIRSTYSKQGEAECGSLGLAYLFILSKKYKHLLPMIEDKVKKDF